MFTSESVDPGSIPGRRSFVFTLLIIIIIFFFFFFFFFWKQILYLSLLC